MWITLFRSKLENWMKNVKFIRNAYKEIKNLNFDLIILGLVHPFEEEAKMFFELYTDMDNFSKIEHILKQEEIKILECGIKKDDRVVLMKPLEIEPPEEYDYFLDLLNENLRLHERYNDNIFIINFFKKFRNGYNIKVSINKLELSDSIAEFDPKSGEVFPKYRIIDLCIYNRKNKITVFDIAKDEMIFQFKLYEEFGEKKIMSFFYDEDNENYNLHYFTGNSINEYIPYIYEILRVAPTVDEQHVENLLINRIRKFLTKTLKTPIEKETYTLSELNLLLKEKISYIDGDLLKVDEFWIDKCKEYGLKVEKNEDQNVYIVYPEKRAYPINASVSYIIDFIIQKDLDSYENFMKDFEDGIQKTIEYANKRFLNLFDFLMIEYNQDKSGFVAKIYGEKLKENFLQKCILDHIQLFDFYSVFDDSKIKEFINKFKDDILTFYKDFRDKIIDLIANAISVCDYILHNWTCDYIFNLGAKISQKH